MTAAPRFQRRARRRSRREQRGVALIMVLGAITVLTIMLTEFQDETGSELSSAVQERDSLKAEYAAKSAVNLSRLLLAAEPTIRKAVAPLFLLMRRGPPQIPVWEFADQVLGAFNDADGAAAFKGLAGVDISEGKNLGLDGAGFLVRVIDEDSKINVNGASRGDAISQARVGAQLLGLMTGTQYDPLFQNRDRDDQFSDRVAICSAVVDWADPDQEGYGCDPHSGMANTAGAEDSFYSLLKPQYQRKNAAYDSLEELRLVRGVGDDFWTTFIEPDPDKPDKRVVTVWGQGAINVNTANPQTLLAMICAFAVPGTALCVDPLEMMKFLSIMNVVKTFTQGAPLFSSAKGFINALKGQGMFGSVFAMMDVKPIQLLSDAEFAKSISTESKVFSIYATGVVKSGKRETRRRIHAVVDFRNAPPPGMSPLGALGGLADLAGGGGLGAGGALGVLGGVAGPAGASRVQSTAQQPVLDANDLSLGDGISAVLKPSAGGNVLYYRVE